MNRKPTTLVRRHAMPLAPPDGLAAFAARAVRGLLQAVGAGVVSHRRVRRLGRAMDAVAEVAATVEQIVEHDLAMTRASAQVAREVAQLETEIDDFRTKLAENELRRKELEIERAHLGAAIEQELRRRRLAAQVEAEELQTRVDALKAARRPAATDTGAHAGVRDRRSAQIPGITDATLERLRNEAARIVREVKHGAVPTGPQQPYHAFAGCVYLQARLDGRDATEAATHTRDELVAQMLTGSEFTLAESRAYGREYKDLKRRLDTAADTRRTTSVLASLKNIGAPAPAPKNGEGVQ